MAITRWWWLVWLKLLLSCSTIWGFMMRKFAKRFFGGAVVSVAMLVAPAQAATWLITAQGTVLSGVDETGVFGFASNTQLAGQAIAAEFLFDDAAPGIVLNGVSAPVSSRVVINGHSASAGARNEFNENSYRGSSSHGSLSIGNDSTNWAGNTQDILSVTAQSDSYNHNFYTRAYVDFIFYGRNNQLSGNLLEDGLRVSLQANDRSDGRFLFTLFDQGQRLRTANGTVKWDRFSIDLTNAGRAQHFQSFVGGPNAFLPSPFGGVPEPTTWALLLFGFGFVGASLRASRRDGVRSVLN